MTRGLTPLLLILLAGCGTASRIVRLDTGRGEKPTLFTPRTGDAQPVQLDVDDFEEAVTELARGIRPSTRSQEAARRLFEVEAQSGSYTYEPHSRRLTPLGSSEHLEGQAPAAELELTRAYLRWCERTGRPGDCLRLQIEHPFINGDHGGGRSVDVDHVLMLSIIRTC